MGADMGGARPGDVVAAWGCGAVGQMAARSAQLLGAERVVVIDRFDYRLEMAELRERSGGRGPDVCIEAIGMEAHAPGPRFRHEQAKQRLRILETDRPHALRQAIGSCRKAGGGSCSACSPGRSEGPGGYDCSRTRRTAACGRCSGLTRK
jgi:threonine dehydrogenase-like Zn-dependent dehydrogenase